MLAVELFKNNLSSLYPTFRRLKSIVMLCFSLFLRLISPTSLTFIIQHAKGYSTVPTVIFVALVPDNAPLCSVGILVDFIDKVTPLLATCEL